MSEDIVEGTSDPDQILRDPARSRSRTGAFLAAAGAVLATVGALVGAALIAGLANRDGADGVGVPWDDDDDCCPDRLSVWDAADIYFCSGFDEDRMFDYSHEELMDAHEPGGW